MNSFVRYGGVFMNTVNVSTYWNEKTELVGHFFDGWNKKEEIFRVDIHQ